MSAKSAALWLLVALLPACAAQPLATPLAAPLAAQESQHQDAATAESWRWSATPYLWAAEMEADISAGAVNLDIDIPFSDTLDNLQSAGLVMLAARKGPWTWMLDNTYLSLDADGSTAGGIPVEVGARLWIAQLNLLHDITDDGQWQGGLGVRNLSYQQAVSIGGLPAVRADKDFTDAVVVGRATRPLNENWDLVGYADVGAGDSDLTWQALASFNYACDDWIIAIGYRVMDYELDSGAVDTDLTLNGPIIGAQFRF
jgi:hypothetical protein